MRVNRYWVAGQIGIVLILLVGVTALRSASEGWAYAVVLVVNGILMLAVVGAVYGKNAERTWWFGFALFGLGYMKLLQRFEYTGDAFPTVKLVDILMTKFDAPLPRIAGGPDGPRVQHAFVVVIHCLWSLGFAALGGALARTLFAAGARRAAALSAEPNPPDERVRTKSRWYGRIGIIVALLLLTTGLFVGARRDSNLFMGVAVLQTWAVIGACGLAAIFSRGTERARWLGATLFGAGCMVLIFDPGPDEYRATWTHRAINDSIRSLWPAIPPNEQATPPSSREIAIENERIRTVLERPVAMEFPRPTPLEDVLIYIKAATQGANEPALRIYVDPLGLQEAEQTMQSTVVLQLEGVPLKRSLDILVKQLGMQFHIHEGILVIDSEVTDGSPPIEDPTLPVAHFILAMIAAGIGGLVAPVIALSKRSTVWSEKVVP